MNPALIAYQTQLMFNLVYADVYIKQAQGFDTSTGLRTGDLPVRIMSVPSVDVPVQKMFKSGPGGVPQQLYSREITFPLECLAGNKVKLNDYVGLYGPYDSCKTRYEVKSILLTANTLITLGLSEQTGQPLGLGYCFHLTDAFTWTESMGATL